MKMCKYVMFSILLNLIIIIQAQDQTGFIMIDCGISENTSYTDTKTGIYYVSDTKYINTGVNVELEPTYYGKQYDTVRAFPEGEKNCYTIVPPYVKNKTRYFIRASFSYSNYDGKNKGPIFDLYLGVNLWAVVDSAYLSVMTFEILHKPTSNFTYVCLVNTGHGTPFISALELRLVEDNIYNEKTTSGSMQLFHRYDVGPYSLIYIRYKDDIYDRIWKSGLMYGGNNTYVNTTNHIDQNSQNSYNLPSPVINNAETSIYPNALSFNHFPDDASTVYHIFLYFADFQNTSTREFDIYFGEKLMVSYFRPKYLSATTVYSILPQSKYHVNVSLLPTARSILPPLLNAYEVYSTKELPNMFTYTGDVDAMKDFKATYRVKRNWEGDPCIPRVFLWEGLDCSNASITDPPRITFLTLTHSKLAGEISPSVFNLKMLQHLDLSFNNLTGEVPEFLAHMSNLTFINLSENNLSGKVPLKLLEKKDMGFLNLRLEGNPHLCKEKSCAVKKKKLFPIIIGLAAGLSVLSIIIIWIYIIRRRRSLQQEVHVDSNGRGTTLFKAKDQNFSYSEVVRITQNFKTVLGSGGFGKVYQGCLEGNQVAVKILSMSSGQGYKQFKAEAELLTKVHHRNLTSLVGYCHEGDKLGLIYEFMANGDLQSQLSEQSHNSLSWELRLDIALDAAQGLEYMHNGCKPPIIHRDVKSTNILLDDNFHAKLGDFGLSRVFATEGSDNLSTSFAGTLGYLDPEYNMNKKSDVFSFGVVLLEIITGKPAISRNEQKMHLSEWVSDTLTTKGDISNVVDPRIGGDFDINSMRKAVDLAMECVSVASNARPKMYNVVMELKRCLDMEKSRFETGDRSDQANYDDSSEINLLNVATTEVSLYAR